MIGDKYRVKVDCSNEMYNLKTGEILTEIDAYNFKTGCREDSGGCNEIVHDTYGFICEVGSKFTEENLERV